MTKTKFQKITAHIDFGGGWWTGQVRYEDPPSSHTWKRIKPARTRDTLIQNIADYVGPGKIISISDFSEDTKHDLTRKVIIPQEIG